MGARKSQWALDAHQKELEADEKSVSRLNVDLSESWIKFWLAEILVCWAFTVLCCVVYNAEVACACKPAVGTLCNLLPLPLPLVLQLKRKRKWKWIGAKQHRKMDNQNWLTHLAGPVISI